MKAKKSLGQHFLTQTSVAERIALSIKPLDGINHVLEVGPGKGMLTQFLFKSQYHVTMVETDRDMIPNLEDTFGTQDTRILNANFLKADLDELMPGPFFLAGNFPYNISSQILFKMLANKDRIPQMVGMFQKEVAERIAAKHGSKTYGILSVLTQVYYDVEYLFSVKPGAFSPPPKVNSGVIRLIRRPLRHRFSGAFEKKLRQVVKMSFNQRRKMIRNSLKSILPENFQDDKEFLTRRPEQMSKDDFIELTCILLSLEQN